MNLSRGFAEFICKRFVNSLRSGTRGQLIIFMVFGGKIYKMFTISKFLSLAPGSERPKK